MAEDDAVLDAEKFIREAAEELNVLRHRAAALAQAQDALRLAGEKLDRAAAELATNSTENRDARIKLEARLQRVDRDIAVAIDAGLANLDEKIVNGVRLFQERALEFEQTRRAVIEETIRDARRSLLDSAKVLSETAAGVAADAKLVSNFSAGERVQWRLTLVNAVGEAYQRLRLAGEVAEAMNRGTTEAAGESSAKLTSAATIITERTRDIETAAASIRAAAAAAPDRAEALFVQMRRLRTVVLATGGVLLVFLFALMLVVLSK